MMGPKYDNIYTLNDIDKIPNEFHFKNYRDCLYGLSDVVISLRKGMFAKENVTVYIDTDDLDGLDKLNFRRPRKQELLRKRYVNEDNWNLALLQFNEKNRVYYNFEEQTRSRGNHSAGKCLIDFEISRPNDYGVRICTVNMRASIVPYNLYYDLILIHNLILEAKQKCGFMGVGLITLNIGLLTIKKGVSFGGLVCMGYHWKDFELSKFFTSDIDYMFDNVEHPSTFKGARTAWDNAYYEMVDRINAGESKEIWRWKPSKKIVHRKKEVIEGTKDRWGNGGKNPDLVKLAKELTDWKLYDQHSKKEIV